VLQLCVLMSPSFATRRADELWDLTRHRCYPCQDRPTLVETLADALLDYAAEWASWELPQPARAQDAWRRIELAVHAFLLLRRQRRVLSSPTLRHLRQNTVRDAARVLRTVVTELSADDYAQIGPFPRLARRAHTVRLRALLLDMYRGFVWYGPLQRTRGQLPPYPKRAAYHVMAELLDRLGILPTKPGQELSDVAQQIRKRLAPPPA
jgi:hypothetical protein